MTRLTRKQFLIAAGGTATAALLPAPSLARDPHPNPMPEPLRQGIERNPAVPVLGNPDGDVTLTEFFDYNCPFCRRNLGDVQALIAADPKLRVVFRDWPVFGEGSMFAAKAALAALRQGKYWKLHAGLMTMKGRAEEASVLRIARQVGIDEAQLREDMEKREILDVIYETMDLADAMSLIGTPTFIAGHESAFGKLSQEDLKKLVADARADLL